MKEIKLIESEISITLFNRLQIGYFSLSDTSINLVNEINSLTIRFSSYKEFINIFSDKQHNDIYVFNNSIIKSTDVWIQPLDMWMSLQR